MDEGNPTTNELPLDCSFEFSGRTRHTTFIASLAAIVSEAALNRSAVDEIIALAQAAGT